MDKEHFEAALRAANSLAYELEHASGARSWSGDTNTLLNIGDTSDITNKEGYLALIHKEDKAGFEEALNESAKKSLPFSYKYRLHLPDNRIIWVHDNATPLDTKKGLKFVGMISLFANETSPTPIHLDSLETFDADFTNEFDKVIEKSLQDGHEGAFLKVAISNFSTIISWYNEDVATQALEELMASLKDMVKEHDIVCRITIDTLGIVLYDINQEDTNKLIKKIQEHVKDFESDLLSDPLRLMCSIGSVHFPQDGKNANDCLHKAYVALSSTKTIETTHRDYASAHEEQVQSKEKIRMMHYMRDAVHHDKFCLAYQPIIEAKSGKTAMYECLLRIIGEDGKISSAGTIIPVAEKLGYIDVVDHFVLERVVETLKAQKDITLAFNVSNLTTDNPKWLALCTKVLSDPEIASRTIVEITETSAQRDMRQTAYFVASLQALGCKVALDDFGAGYTSFRQLKSLSVDIVKIDGGFIMDLSRNSENILFIKTLLDFNQSYGLKTIAECVESGEVAKILMDLEVDYMQGYYFGIPEIERPWEKEEDTVNSGEKSA